MDSKLKEITEEIFIIIVGKDYVPKETNIDFWKVSELVKKYHDV